MKSKVKSKYVEKMERIIVESRYADEFQQNKNRSKINIISLRNNAKNRKMLLEERVREGKWAQRFLETGVGDGSISIKESPRVPRLKIQSWGELVSKIYFFP